jgi:uncharacterized protein DUF3631/uncharacterized protein DUF3854
MNAREKPKPSLAEAYLCEREISLDTFREHGGEIDASPGSEKIAKRLRRNSDRVRLDKNWQGKELLWIPLYDSGGEFVCWVVRVLPIYGEKIKFLMPNGSQSFPWIPRATHEVANDIDVPIFITEGPIKGMMLRQAGVFPIALIGVWGVATAKEKESNPIGLVVDFEEAGKNGEHEDKEHGLRKLHAELADHFSWVRRPTYLCFDADQMTNMAVRQAVIRCAFLLYAAGAEVLQLSWPVKEGKGIDDYIAAKAGADPKKQRAVLDELTKCARPFVETLDRQDIDAVRKEIHRTQPTRAHFHQLAKVLAKHLGITKPGLGEFSGDGDGDSSANLHGAEPIDIPPTAAPWEEEVKAEEVLNEICGTIARFVWMKASQYRAVALWIVLSYLHDVIDILPILLITSPEPECAKTTLLDIVFNLCNRPITASNISTAAIYRTIGDDRPTLLLDEADTFVYENEAMRGVIDSGHKRRFAFVIRVVNDAGDTGRFSTWCPKVLAMIGLPKRTILSRSIHIGLERKEADLKVEKLKDRHFDELEELRRKISRLANDIRTAVKTYEGDGVLGNRAADNWRPLFAIASAAGDEWLEKTVQAAQRMTTKDAQDSKSFGRYLLESLDLIIHEKRESAGLPPGERIFLPSLELVAKLNEDKEAPWNEKKDSALTVHKFSKELKKFDIESEQVKQPDQDRSRGYWSDGIEKAIKQYAQTERNG